VARNAKAGYDVRREGVRTAPERMIIYASQETHSSVQKAVELLGMGSATLRLVIVNDDFQMDLKALEAAIAQDRKQGHRPFCIVGAAGTTNTGAVDDLDALADVCQKENLWFHVDGAFGAWAALAPDVKHLVMGMEQADSLALDLHKWMYMPYEIGCILVRHEEAHRRTFSLTPDYLIHGQGGRGLTGGDLTWLTDYGFALSRRFNALKAWMSFKEHGVRKYGRLIQQNVDQARYLASLVDASPALERAAPVPLNVVCFRYVKPGMDDTILDTVNEQIIVELQEQGIAVPSGTIVRGRYVLHVAITNHRSCREDFDVLVREIIRIGDGLVRD